MSALQFGTGWEYRWFPYVIPDSTQAVTDFVQAAVPAFLCIAILRVIGINLWYVLLHLVLPRTVNQRLRHDLSVLMFKMTWHIAISYATLRYAGPQLLAAYTHGAPINRGYMFDSPADVLERNLSCKPGSLMRLPCYPFRLEIGILYVAQFSYYAWSLFEELYRYSRGLVKPTWKIYVAHDASTIAVVFLSWFHGASAWMGIYTMFLHDTVDILVYANKAVSRLESSGGMTRLRLILAPMYASLMALYAYNRLYLFSRAIWYSHLLTNSYFEEFMIALCVVLEACHCVWYLMMLRAAYQFITVGRVDDFEEDAAPTTEEIRAPNGAVNGKDKKDA